MITGALAFKTVLKIHERSFLKYFTFPTKTTSSMKVFGTYEVKIDFPQGEMEGLKSLSKLFVLVKT